MAVDWPTATIAECAANEPYSTQIGPFGDKIRAEIYKPAGAPILRGTNVNTAERFHDADFVFIDSEAAENEFNKFVCEADDVILCHKGTLGKIGIVPRRNRYTRYIMGNSMMKVRCDKTKLEPLFLYYWLTSQDGQDYLFSRVSQVGVPQIQRPLTTLREATIPLPPIQEQRAIAHILGTLDDKIELTRRMNATLETMARALFKSWFVDFDPVRAKAEGRDPGLPQPLAELFPDSFEDSKLGKIPRGWNVALAESLFDVAIGKTPPRKEHHWFSTDPQDVPWMSIKDLGQAGAFIAEVSEYLTSAAVERFRVRRIPDGTVVLSFKLTVGRVAITDGEMLSNEAIAHFLPHDETFLSPAYLYCYLRQFDYERLGSTSSIATAVNSGSVRSIPVLVPARAIHLAFDRETFPLFCRMKSTQCESRALVTLRDALLPKLISGELRIQNGDRLVAETAA